MKMLSVYELMTNNALATNTTTYTVSIKSDFCTGYGTLYVSNSAGAIKILQQVSKDNLTWIFPTDESNNTLALVGTGITAGTTGMIQYNPVLAPYTRYAVIEGSSKATTFALTAFLQEEK